MSKIELIELVVSTKISPFNWGDNSEDLIKIFPKWKIRINELREAKCPFIEIDSVEFYFEDDEFNGLSEIIIKTSNFGKGYYSEYFNLSWLENKITFKRVLLELEKLKLEFKIEFDKHFKSPIIIINKSTFLGFENSYSGRSENSKLEKIYIRR
jgi:hypothetical protein